MMIKNLGILESWQFQWLYVTIEHFFENARCTYCIYLILMPAQIQRLLWKKLPPGISWRIQLDPKLIITVQK